jgi:monoamine oxidase
LIALVGFALIAVSIFLCSGFADRLARTLALWNLRDDWYPLRDTTRYKIDRGNDKLPRAFAEKLKERIHYGSPVVQIEQEAVWHIVKESAKRIGMGEVGAARSAT